MASRTDHPDHPRTKLTEELAKLDGTDRAEGKEPSAVEAGEVTERTAGQIRDVIDALDPEISTSNFYENDKRKTLSTNTLKNYAQRLRMAATELDADLMDLDTNGVLAFIADLENARTEIGPADGYASGTIGQYQCALKAFYRYHDGHDVDPERIPVATPEKTKVDERDMFTVEEVKALRAAIDSRRNRAMFELLAYTGQRIRVIQTLRVKDVDVTEGATGAYYVNEEVEGRKGREGKGPLLGAKEYVRRWLEVHPTREPDDYLLTPIPANGGGGTPGEMLTQDTIRYHLRRIAKQAGVNKDVHPHIFRHYFTTIAKRDYDLDNDYIKRLRGDAPGSNVMETTYRHLSDDDAVKHAEAKYEGREIERETVHSPEICPTCKKELEDGAKACSRCGDVFTPDAAAAQQSMQGQAEARIPEVRNESEARVVAAALRELRENPVDAVEET